MALNISGGFDNDRGSRVLTGFGEGTNHRRRVPRQREAIRRYAKAHGIAIVDEHRDEGASGSNDLDHRNGLSDLMARIRSNGVRLVLVERADRLARDLMVSEVYLPSFTSSVWPCSPPIPAPT